MSENLVISIGWARAASTALRHNFFMRHPEIVTAWRGQPAQEGPASLTLEAMKTANDEEFRHRLPALKETWARHLHRTGGLVCLSDEELSIGLPAGIRPHALAARCADLFPNARILAVVREQTDAIRSFYQLAQREVFRDRTTFPDWLDRHLLSPAAGEGFAYLYAYAKTLRAYRDHGFRNMLVLEYSRVRESPHAVYAEIARWLGVSEAVCGTFPNAVINASPRRGASWPEGRAAAVRALYAEDNRALSEEFQIDLSAMAARTSATPHAD